MNSCNTIRSVELLYYCYWCTYIACTLPVNALLLHYRNLLSCLLCFSIFLVYISCFALFSFYLISVPLFSKDGYPNLSYFPMRKSAWACSCTNCIQFHIIIMQKNHSSISWDNFHCILYVQSFFVITSHWIFKWWEVF